MPRVQNGTRPATKTDDQIAQDKKNVIDELNQTFAGLKENCFPLPRRRCQCVTTVNGKEVVTKYDTDTDCKKPSTPAPKNKSG